MASRNHHIAARISVVLAAILAAVSAATLSCATSPTVQGSRGDGGDASALALDLGLSGLPLLSNTNTRSISAENPTGEKGKGAMADPRGEGPASELGTGWKVRPSISLRAHSLTTLARIDGPGVVQHIWMTLSPKGFRDCVLRFYWDGEDAPSVEVPVGDFFANGHGLAYNVNSLPVAVNPSGGLNCYWPMPFRKSCTITIENQGDQEFLGGGGLYYQITYSLGDVRPEAACFHAQWRRATADPKNANHVILDTVKGKGHYVGTFLAWTQLHAGWWGEGEIKFYIDGDSTFPTICGTGTEDYFGGAWCFGSTYSTAFLGYPLSKEAPGKPPLHCLYRWHILDSIRFERDLRVTIQALGWGPNGKFKPLADDIASVGYWYQTEPHAPFPSLPPAQDRRPN